MAITLVDVGSGHNRSSINSNFQAIEAEINNELLDRDGGKALRADLDFNSNDLLNGGRGDFSSLFVEGVRVYGGTGTAPINHFDTITPMLAVEGQIVGDIYIAGGTVWQVDTVTDPMVIENYTALTEVNIKAFGAKEDASNASPALQAALNYASPRKKEVRVLGAYTFSSKVNLQSYSTINAEGSNLTVTTGLDILFDATVAGTAIAYITIKGGTWTEDAVDLTASTCTFLNAVGDYNGGSILFVDRGNYHSLKVLGFNYFMVSDFHRTWNLTNCFIRARNGVKAMRKNVETNITNCLIFGNDTLDSTTIGIEVGADIDAAVHPSMYPEGFKVHNCTIDQFYSAVTVREVLDLNIYDSWMASGTTDANLRYALKFELNPNGNNFMTGVHIHNNTFARSLIEFVDHAGSPTLCILEMSDNIYTSAQTIRIGQRWHGINMQGWMLQSVSPKVGINLVNDNADCSFKDMRFKGSWSGLIQVNNNVSYDCVIDNVWSDEYVADPFYVETPIRIVNSMCGTTPASSASNGGQVIHAGQAVSAVAGANIYTSPTLRFKTGAIVEVKVHGIFNNTLATGTLEIVDSTGTVLEPIASGVGWDSKYIELDNTRVRVDTTCLFRVISQATTTIDVKSLTGDTTCTTHSHVSIRYI